MSIGLNLVVLANGLHCIALHCIGTIPVPVMNRGVALDLGVCRSRVTVVFSIDIGFL
jgi:hypothetical protein